MESYIFYSLVFLCVFSTYIFKNKIGLQYYVKFIIYGLYWIIACFILLPVFALHPRNPYNFVVSGKLAPYLISLMNLKYVVRGKEYMKTEESHVVVLNHQSCLDAVGIYSIWHLLHRCTIIAKKEVGYFLPFLLAGWLCNIIFIDRSNLKTTKITMKEAGMKIRQEGTKVVIFPEGRRYQTGKIEPFKKGAFHMAIDCQLPILPIVFSRYYFLDGKRKIFNPGTIIISALPPIPTTGLSTENITELMQRTYKIMSDEFKKISMEAVYI